MSAGPARAGGKGGQLGRIPPEVWAALLDDAKARPGAREGVPAWARAVPLLAGGAVIERARAVAAGRAGRISLRKLRYRIGWPGLSQGLLRAPQKPHGSAAWWAVPTGIPRTKRHTPVHLLCVLKVWRTVGQQHECA
jgi:hypothetical protein